ncbi:uncharacterized protein DS421_13g402400 [Arachis hypogaea]|nr:uncharacterized protein DS421_13g402400 [Arachis hypogaea]
MKQIHDLQEHIQEKDRQLIELQEQHRVAQETLMYKDEQLREVPAWINRVRDGCFPINNKPVIAGWIAKTYRAV